VTDRHPRWKTASDNHDFPAAAQYLSLLADEVSVKSLVRALHRASPEQYKAKDILRAAGLRILPVDNPHVASDLAKIRAGTALSPILLVRGDLISGRPLQIADGYHRICASYHTDANADIPCRTVVAETAEERRYSGGHRNVGGHRMDGDTSPTRANR